MTRNYPTYADDGTPSANQLKSYCWEGVKFIQLVHCIIMFIISQLWLTSHPRSTVVLLDTGTPGTSREIYSEDADDGIRTRNPSVINRVL